MFWFIVGGAIVVVILAVVFGVQSEEYWKRGKGYRCNYRDPHGRQCELDHLHWTDLCVTHDKYGGEHHWRGLNYEWDPTEGVHHLRPKSWRGLP